jgi:hypothetical protein
MRHEFLRARNKLLVERVLYAPVNTDDNRLVGLAAHHHALKNSLRHLVLLRLGRAALIKDCHDTSNISAHVADPRRVFKLTARPLEAQIKGFLAQIAQVLS